MSKITLDNLSDNLKAYLEGLGLSEEQVLNLINENGLDEEELKVMLKDTMHINELNTNSKTVIGAINELFQDVDNGKNLIATSIGNPLVDGNSSFKAMSEAILGLRRTSENETDAKEVLYNMMIEDGYNEANINMTVDELIELLDDSGIQVDEIKQIACGTNHTFILKNDGSIWSCGLNHVGQLGLGDTDNRTTFTQVTTNINNDVKEVSCGYYRTFILKNDGSIWSCGNNDRGQLGLGDATTRTTFTQVTTNINNDVKLISCGDYHTFIIKNDGSVWSCGYNQYGQLGLGDVGNKSTFTQVTTNINNDVKLISCGEYHTFILKNDGSVWSCGYNQYGQLGLNDTTYRNTFTKVTTNINNDVKQIACGYNYTFILKNDGSVWSCGYNYHGQLGLNNTTNRTTFTQVTTNINNDVKQISCGNAHTFILKNDGSVWSCGYNDQGQLGLNDTTNRTTFTQVTTNINNDVKQISCGYHTFILKNDGSVWGCGYNNYGQLGLGSTTQKNTFNIIPNMSNTISEYEIQRLKLYYYLLDNSVNVTESMDIGTMLDLLVDDYINKLILGYENNLRIILTDEGVSVSDEDNMDSLITKVDEEFDNMNDEISNTRNKLADLLIESGIDITYEDDLNSLLTKLEGMIVIDSSASVNGIVTKVTEYIFEGIMDDYKEVVYLNHKIIGDTLFLVVNGRKDLSQNIYETSMAKYNLSTQSLEKIQQITQTNNGKYDSCYFLDDSVIFIYNLYEITQYSLDTFTTIKSIYRNSDINTTATPVFKLLHENYLFLFFNGYYRDAAKIFRLNLTNMTIDKRYEFNASLINYGNALMASSFIFIHDGYIYASGYYSGTATGYIAKLSFDLTLIEYSNSTTIANFGLAYIYNNRINGMYFVNYTDGVQLAVMTFDLGNNYVYEYNIYPTSDILASAGSNYMDAKFIDGDENHFYINYLGEVIKVNKQDFSIVAEYNISSKDTIINISNNELSAISKDYISKYKFYN